VNLKLGRPRNDEILVTPENVVDLDKASREIEIAFPSIFMVPNVAQYRALEVMYGPVNESGKIPDMVSVEFANACGKTHLFILDEIGWTLGPDYLCWEAFPECAIDVYRRAAEKRDKGLLSLRVVCVSDDMKAGGSLYELHKQVFPWAKITAPDSGRCFRQIDVPHPTKKGVINSFTVKTFEQSTDSHSGSTCDRILINENLPDSLWGETNGRIRSKKGEAQGTIAQFATRLSKSQYLNNFNERAEGKFIFKRAIGHIYENCVGEEVTDEMANEVFREIGVILEKNPEGPGYITNGVLTRETIEAKIEGWMQGSPHEVEARKSGKPIDSGGKIYANYHEDIHVIPDDTYQSALNNCPVGQVVDPHSARPDASIWFQILPSDRLVIIDEWPTFKEFGDFDAIKSKRFTVPEKCEIWSLFESTRGYDCGDHRVGDPNRFREPNSEDTGMLLDLYGANGFDFNIDVNDELEYGHELVNQYLWCDLNVRRLSPNDPAAQPRLVVYKRCQNTINAFSDYSRNISRDENIGVLETIGKRRACFAALIRYLVVWHKDGNNYDRVKVDKNRKDEYDAIKYGRIPPSQRGSFGKPGINTHGRHLISSVKEY
jgi:hypothetical protein